MGVPSGAARAKIRLEMDGLLEPIMTDVRGVMPGGRTANRFGDQSWVRPFLKMHGLGPGDTIAIERLGSHRYRVSPFDAKSRQRSSVSIEQLSPESRSGPTVIELFAGCGGMALGFVRAGFETLLANEWDRAASDSLRANITQRVLNCPIQEIGTFPKADVVAGGPPCQGFSNLGERVPNDPRNQLWRHFFRCVRDAQPKVFVIENVPPLLKSAEFEEMRRMAERLGYDVASGVLNTADYGAPQTRKRAIVIGSRVGKATMPAPTHVDPRRVNLLNAALPRWRTVRDAIGHLPIDPDGRNWHVGRNPTAKSLARYAAIPPGGNRWDIPAALMPECWKRKTSGGTDLFGRLWWDRPSVTIRTEFYKPEKGRYLHPVANRPITHLEASLLQSFPPDFEFCGSKSQVGVQIGNAVPPVFAREIAEHVTQLLGMSVERPLMRIGG